MTDRAERALVKAAYVTVVAFSLAMLLVFDASRPLLFFDPTPRESLLLVSGSADAVEFLQKSFVVVFYGVLASLLIALIVRRLIRATPRARRILAPLMVGGVAVALRAVFESVFTFSDRPFAYNVLFWWQIAALIALPIALLAGLLRARLARAGVSDLVLALERTPPQGIRDALAHSLGDPTLTVAFWLPEQREFVDANGMPVELPSDDSRRVITRLEHEGEPLAAFVHDASLLDEPELLAAAGATARLALETARLHAELRAQLVMVQKSRVRIVSATDEERRRIERDLHDGAQQRLVALALQLRGAAAARQRRSRGGQAPDRDDRGAAGRRQRAPRARARRASGDTHGEGLPPRSSRSRVGWLSTFRSTRQRNVSRRRSRRPRTSWCARRWRTS